MKILDVYIARVIISAVLVVTLALLGFDLFFNLTHELQAVGKGNYTLSAACIYLILTIPSRLYMLFPWSALIGSLIGLGALASHSELVVMRTSGVSVARITWAAMKAACILMVIVVFLGEGIAPITTELAKTRKALALSDGQTLETAYGVWVRQGRAFMHIQSVQAKDRLVGVARYVFDVNRTLTEALYAQSAELQRDGQEGKHEIWQLNQVQGTRFFQDKTSAFKENTMRISDLLAPEILETVSVKHPERLSMIALFRVIRHRAKNDLDAQHYEIAFWGKILRPVVVLMMVFLAVPFVFGPLRTVSMGFRVVSGLIVAFLFHTLNSLFTPLAVVYQAPPILAVLMPVLLFSGIGFWILRRIR